MAEKDYPSRVLPEIKRLSVGEDKTWNRARAGSIRSMLTNYQMTCLRRFETRTVGNEIIVARIGDAEKKL